MQDIEGKEPAEPRVLDSAELLKDQKSVVIRHQSEHYKLSVTRQNKLILTK